MRLSIPAQEAARVAFDVRLNIRSEDLNAYQAATLSKRTFIDASIDMGADDFPNDAVRLAARDLAGVLSREKHLAAHSFDRTTHKTICPGRLVFCIAYPVVEADIRQSIIACLVQAAEQKDFVTKAEEAFNDWVPKVAKSFAATSKSILKKHQKLLAAIQLLKYRRKSAVENLDKAELLALIEEYADCAQALPKIKELESELSSAFPAVPQVLQRASVSFQIEHKFGVVGFHTTESATSRIDAPQPSAHINLDLCPREGHPFNSQGRLKCELVIKGSLIEACQISLSPPFHDLDPLFEEIRSVYEHWGSYSSSEPPKDITEALLRIDKQEIQEEMNRWIAEHGSPSLQLGHEQKFSMTRQYRLERGQSVIEGLLSTCPGWTFVLEGDMANQTRFHLKASPSERALNALVAIKTLAPDATIYHSPSLTDQIAAENEEFIWIPEAQCFPGSPAIAICWPLAKPAKKTARQR